MKCPNCNETLLMTERQSVEIDYCPSCRGVWLDKGELDKLLEFAAQKSSSKASDQSFQSNKHTDHNRYTDNREYSNDRPYSDSHKYSDNNKYHGRKKKSFLSDFFDFD